MLQNKEDMKHAYESLKQITNKPTFEDVWKIVINFLTVNHLIK